VEITAAVAADLAALTEALDDPEIDLARTFGQLVADAKLAVRSFLGLSVRVASGGPALLTALDGAEPADVGASLLIPKPAGVAGAAEVDVILFAAAPGAFTDLAADLAWLAGRALHDFPVDQHLALAAEPDSSNGLAALSLVNQAIGVLIAGGHSPEQAERVLDASAVRAGVERHLAARQILAGLDGAPRDHRDHRDHEER